MTTRVHHWAKTVSRRWVAVVIILLLGGYGLTSATTANADPREAPKPVTRSQVVTAAARIGRADGYYVGLAVLDRRTGRVYTGGNARGMFATESVVKVLIATRLLIEGRMHGRIAHIAYKMITQSDDASADALYGPAGGDGLMTWTKRHFHLPDLGEPPHHAGWWGNTHISPVGLVQLYAKLAVNHQVAPWLLNAMHHAHHYGSDGTYQYFGIASASKGAAIKQGWGCDFTSGCSEADFNSTGFVDHNRFAVALLARGPLNTYGGPISRELTKMAEVFLPGGEFPPPPPVVSHVSVRRTSVHGGAAVTIRGRDFVHVKAVYFGRAKARKVTVVSPTRLRAIVPGHSAGAIDVIVCTGYGRSPKVRHDKVNYIGAPAVSSQTAATGPESGGTRVTLRGRSFIGVRRVLVGRHSASSLKVASASQLSFTTPAGPSGTVPITVVTKYGTSDGPTRFTYVGAPAISAISPSTTTTKSTRVTVTGTNFVNTRAVTFDGKSGSDLVVSSRTSLTVTAPAHQAGTVRVEVRTAFGMSTPGTLTYTAAPVIATNSLPDATVGMPYSATLSTSTPSGGTWSIVSGALPQGLSLSGSQIAGTPTAAGSSTVTVQFTDTLGRKATQSLSLTVH